MHVFNSPRKATIKASAYFLLLFFVSLAQASWLTGPQPNSIGTENGAYGKFWSQEYRTEFARPADSFVDNAGNMYLAATIDNGTSGNEDVLVSKVDINGNVLWQTTYSFNPLSSDRAVSIEVDANNNVIVGLVSDIEHSYVGATTITDINRDFVAIKFPYDAATQVLATDPIWVATYDSLSPTSTCLDFIAGTKSRDCGQDELVAMAVDLTGNIWLTGTSNDGSVSQFNNISTIGVDGITGAVVTESAVYDNGANDHPIGIVVDGTGNVFVAGTSLKTVAGTFSDKDIVVIRYSELNGSVLSISRYDSGYNDAAFAMAFDSLTNSLYVAGETMDATAVKGVNDVLLVKFDNTGNFIWRNRYSSDAKKAGDGRGGHDSARAIAIDNAGDVYVAAKVKGIANYDLGLIKFDDVGGQAHLWASLPYDSGDDDTPTEIVLSDNGEVFVGALLGNLGSYDSAFVRYDQTTGDRLSVTIDNGVANDTNLSFGLFTGIENAPAVILVNGSEERSQQAIQVKRFDIARPDLEVIAGTGPAIGVYYQTIDVNATLRNFQDSFVGKIAHAAAFNVGFYLDNGINPPILVNLHNENPLIVTGNYPVSGLDSGAVLPISTTLSIVNTIPEGFYKLNAYIDHTGLVPEANDTNNVFTIQANIQIINPPDLNAVSVSGTPSLPAATPLDITFDYSNITEVTALAPFDIEFMLSTDLTISPDDIVLGTFTRTTDMPGFTDVINAAASYVVPNDTPAGQYYIIMDIIPDRSIIEARYNNNTIASQTQIEVLPIPDLIVPGVSILPLGALEGGLVDVTDTVRNNAVGGVTADAGEFTIGIYFSSDTIIDPAVDQLLATRIVTGLIAGADNTATTSVTIPSVAGQQGRYYIGTYADDASVVEVVESNETNNTGNTAISIGLPAGTPGALPDLVITSVVLNQASQAVVRDTTISVTARVENILPEPINTAFNVGYYISRDAVITTSDQRIGTASVASLAGNTPVDVLANDLFLQSTFTESVSWITNSGVAIDLDNTARATAASFGGMAYSAQSFPEDGWVDFSTKENNIPKLAGLNDVNGDNSFFELNYAFYLRNNTGVYVYENGAQKKLIGVHAAGDILRIQREGNQVFYYLKGVKKYTNKNAISAPLFFDTAFPSRSATISQSELTTVLIGTGTHYLGAIADVDNSVTELLDDNNAGIQADPVTGDPISTVVSVVNKPGNGGGAINMISLLILLALTVLLLTMRHKINQVARLTKV